MNHPKGTIIVMTDEYDTLSNGSEWTNVDGKEEYECTKSSPDNHYRVGEMVNWTTNNPKMWTIILPKEDLFDSIYKRLVL